MAKKKVEFEITRPKFLVVAALAITGLIAAVQQRFAGHRFALDGTPEGHHDVVRFQWALAADWAVAGLPVAASPESPSDSDAIDYLLFVHDRHDGNLDAARRYLEWETGLLAQCTADELATFRLPVPAQTAA